MKQSPTYDLHKNKILQHLSLGLEQGIYGVAKSLKIHRSTVNYVLQMLKLEGLIDFSKKEVNNRLHVVPFLTEKGKMALFDLNKEVEQDGSK